MFLTIILVTIYCTIFWSTAVGVGKKILLALKFKDTYAIELALAYYIGFGILINLFVILGLLGQFTLPVIVGVFLVVILTVHKTIQQSLLQFFSQLRYLFQLSRQSLWTLLPLLLTIVLISLFYLACFAAPSERDELSYHLAEANLLADSHALHFPHGGHFFYGNIPLLMEVTYALGITVSGYSLAHVLHYLLFVHFIIFCFGWFYKHDQFKNAIWIGVGLFSLNTIANISTTGLVDTAFMVFEITGLLLSLEWLKNSNRTYLILSGGMLGLAIAIKYSPLFTVAFVGVMMLFSTVFVKKTGWRGLFNNLLAFSVPLLLLGGFWYIKNLILYHNPTYPLLFGHAGVDDAQYLSLVNAIQDFVVPQTFANYLHYPITFYGVWAHGDNPLLSLAYSPNTITTMLIMILLPLNLLIKRRRAYHLILIGYVLLFSLYWFFMATHQVRFLETINLVLLLLAVITITQLTFRIRLAVLAGISGICLLVVIKYFTSFAPLLILPQFVLNLPKVNYTLGRLDRTEYLAAALADCGIAVLDYLDTHDPQANVLDNWSILHNPQFRFYDKRSRFYNLPDDTTIETTPDFLTAHQISYIYVNSASKELIATSSEPNKQIYYAARIEPENDLLTQASLIYTVDSCQLYQLP